MNACTVNGAAVKDNKKTMSSVGGASCETWILRAMQIVKSFTCILHFTITVFIEITCFMFIPRLTHTEFIEITRLCVFS